MNNVEVIKQYRVHFKQRNIIAALELVSENAEWHSDNAGGGWSGSHYGKDAILRHLNNIGKECQLLLWETHSIFPYTAHQVIEVATVKFKFLTTGEEYESDVVCFFGLEDGFIVSYKIYENELKLIDCYKRVLKARL